jgi:hypothetical protein
MGLWDKIKGRKSEGDESGSDRTPSIDRPTHVVTYKDESGKPVTLQTYSAVSADEIKREHPDAKITPTKHQ